MKNIISGLVLILLHTLSVAQTYTTTIDTFYVQTPEYSVSIGIDSLHFPCAVTTPDSGSDFPILILVHGTSALDMNASSTKDYLDSIGANYRKAKTFMFSEIADHLSKNDIMVLRYDKRSYSVNCIEKPACWYADTISPYDYIKDIHRAIEFAKTLPEVDTCNIFLAGHSQGGSFVSHVGYERSDVRGVLDMAGTAQPIDSVSIYQTEFIDGDPAGANILRSQFDSLRNNLWPMTDTLYKNHFSPRFWLDWISHTDSAVLVQRDSDKPTALMYGTADKFVPSNIHYSIWQDSVTRSNAAFQLFTDIDHSFGTEYDSTMSPQVLNFMSDWIQNNIDICGSTDDASTVKGREISIYPNPAKDVISIRSQHPEPIPFQLLNAHGKTIATGEASQNQETTIDVSNLAKGIYFVRTNGSIARIIKM